MSDVETALARQEGGIEKPHNPLTFMVSTFETMSQLRSEGSERDFLSHMSLATLNYQSELQAEYERLHERNLPLSYLRTSSLYFTDYHRPDGPYFRISERLVSETLARLGYMSPGETLEERRARIGSEVVGSARDLGVMRYDSVTGEQLTRYIRAGKIYPNRFQMALQSDFLPHGFTAQLMWTDKPYSQPRRRQNQDHHLVLRFGFKRIPTAQARDNAIMQSLQP